jgi:hypothetical protein
MRTSVNIWHDITVVVTAEKGRIKFALKSAAQSAFPSFRLWQDGKRISNYTQGALSDLWDPDSSDPNFVKSS